MINNRGFNTVCERSKIQVSYLVENRKKLLNYSYFFTYYTTIVLDFFFIFSFIT